MPGRRLSGILWNFFRPDHAADFDDLSIGGDLLERDDSVFHSGVRRGFAVLQTDRGDFNSTDFFGVDIE